VVSPLGEYDKSSFQKSLNKFRPTGWTPLAAAIEQAKDDLSGKTGENVENIIYVVSDGIETCGGDPVKAAQELHQSEIQAIVNIIGFDVDNEGQRALKKVAEAGGGEFTTVNTGEDLRKHLEREYDRLRDKWHQWGLESRMDVNSQMLDKWGLLSEASNSILDKLLKERERMWSAKDYLEESGKFKDDGVGRTLYQKIWNRSQMIKNYRNDRYQELSNRLKQERNNERQRVMEKASEMQKQYEQ
jgi:Ca-activated chloride channel homolog